MIVHHKAFTIIEALVGVVILVLVGAVAVFFQGNIFSIHNILDIGFGAQQEARKTLKQFVAEVRSASPSSAGAYPILTAATSTFTFYSDIDNDGLRERVRYFTSGTTLRKGIIKPTGSPPVYATSSEVLTTIVRDVVSTSSATFEYFDTNYAGTTSPLTMPVDPLQIRLVRLRLIIDRIPNRPPEPITFLTEVSIRNVKDNL